MELIALLAIGAVLAIPIIAIVALVRSNATDRKIAESWYKISDLQGEIAALKHEVARLSARVTKQETAVASPASESQEAKREAAMPAAAAAPAPVEKTTVPPPQPAPAPIQPAQPPMPPQRSEPHPVSATGFATAQSVQPPIAGFEVPARPAVAKDKETAPRSPAQTPAPSASRAPAPPTPTPMPSFAARPQEPPRESVFQRLRTNLPLEQFLGMNLFAKIGIVLLVLGFALLGHMALVAMGPAVRVALIYAISAAMLIGGIWLERRDRYRLLGHTGIGGGWALLFFTTYAMHNVPAMTVMRSNTLDCILMLIVAVAMVAHTLRYRSELVTGLAFLLAFSTVALSQNSVYALLAGVILALGIAAISLRMSWFGLEVFGIIASYANHFYWLHKLYPDGLAGHSFPQFWPSAIILVLYWAVFRVSYVVRKIGSPRQEALSTVAALANTMLLLGVMKFQSTHPELAFYALLGIGVLEFLFGQLPITRRRRAAFALLTVVGTLLIFAAVPFKFSGNNIALFWMIAAETLLVAGIVQKEVLFRRLGLLAGALTGLLIVFEARSIVEFRLNSEALLLKDGVLLLTCSVLYCFNALYLRSKWHDLFREIDGGLAVAQSYLGGITAFLGAWALFTSDWTAVAWAVLLLVAAFSGRRLKSSALVLQAWLLAGAVLVRAAVFNLHFENLYPHHLAMRLFTVPLLALIFYCTCWVLDETAAPSRLLRSASLCAGTALLASLAPVELRDVWIAPAWTILAVALCLIGRRFCIRMLSFQEHVLAVAAVAQLFAVNLDAARSIDRYLPMMACAAAFYAVSRFCTQKEASYRRPAAWLHTWTATTLLASLAWHESSQPWLAVIWVLFALALAIIDRVFTVEELPWQAHTLALFAVVSAATFNFSLTEKLHGADLRLITVSIVIAALYSMARWVRMPAALESREARHVYTWVSSGLAAWLLWCELPRIGVAPGLGVFAILLFEIGAWSRQRQLCLQSYALLAASFVRIFLVNLTATTPLGTFISPRMYSVVPLTLIYFFVWSRLQSAKAQAEFGRTFASQLTAYFGTASVVALLYYELAPQWIIAGWAFVVVALMAAALVLDKEVFLEHTALLTASIFVRGLVHNIFGSSYLVSGGWRGKFSVVSLTSALLFASLPMAFRIRRRYQDRPRGSLLAQLLAARRPDQILFFAPLLLIVLTISVKMNPGMVTLAWAIVGLAVILLGLLAGERSYRLTGLALLVLCIAKIVFRDAWHLGERDRYITFIVLGAALILVSALYSKYRDQVSRLL